MSYESRAYDNKHGDPVVVLVTTGTHDVSRLMNLLAGSRMALCEHMGLSGRILRQVNRHNGGRAALKLLVEHGGPDLSDPEAASLAEENDQLRADLDSAYATLRALQDAESWSEISEIYGEFGDVHREQQDGAVSS